MKFSTNSSYRSIQTGSFKQMSVIYTILDVHSRYVDVASRDDGVSLQFITFTIHSLLSEECIKYDYLDIGNELI